DVLLDCDAPDIEPNGPRVIEKALRAEMELLDVDAAAPDADVLETLLLEFVLEGLRRDHQGRGGRGEPANEDVAPADRKTRARVQVLRKPRVEARRERMVAPNAEAPRR